MNKNCNYLEDKCHWETPLLDFCHAARIEPGPLLLNQFNSILFGGKPTLTLASQSYLKFHTRYCPLCLNEDAFHRLHWDISFLTACTKHNILLIERCASCGRQIKLSNLMRGACIFGYPYNEVQGQKVHRDLQTIQDVLNALLLQNQEMIY